MNTSDISFVVQGAIDRAASPVTGKPVTESCLASLRRYHPGAEIILSTWHGEDVRSFDFDTLVLNHDPGAVDPHTSGYGVPRLDNMNRQIVSTRNGLARATRKYAAKVRSDLIFQGNQWIEYVDRYQARVSEWKVFRERVVTCSMWTRDPRCPHTNFPFHPTDWIHIGLREDINLLWDIPLEPQPESSHWFSTRPLKHLPPIERDLARHHVDNRRYYPEQYLWATLLHKYDDIHFDERRAPTPADISLTELTFANNLIILDPNQFPFVNHKYPYPLMPGYRNYRFIAHKEWEWLYLQRCAGNRAAAALRKAADKDFWLKNLYVAAFGPQQAFRKAAAAWTNRGSLGSSCG